MKAYYNRQGNLLVGMGALQLIFGVAALRSTGTFAVFGVGVILLMIGLATKATPVIRMGADRVEIQRSVLRSKIIVPLNAIRRLDETNPRFLVVETSTDSVKIPLLLLKEPERKQLVVELRQASRPAGA